MECLWPHCEIPSIVHSAVLGSSQAHPMKFLGDTCTKNCSSVMWNLTGYSIIYLANLFVPESMPSSYKLFKQECWPQVCLRDSLKNWGCGGPEGHRFSLSSEGPVIQSCLVRCLQAASLELRTSQGSAWPWENTVAAHLSGAGPWVLLIRHESWREIMPVDFEWLEQCLLSVLVDYRNCTTNARVVFGPKSSNFPASPCLATQPSGFTWGALTMG
jgi:hypothetical protein